MEYPLCRPEGFVGHRWMACGFVVNPPAVFSTLFPSRSKDLDDVESPYSLVGFPCRTQGDEPPAPGVTLDGGRRDGMTVVHRPVTGLTEGDEVLSLARCISSSGVHAQRVACLLTVRNYNVGG